MKLLVAQLKNQDPNNPLDTKELVTQLSQLTSVEQLVSIGDKMQTLTDATNSMATNQSSGLIGRTVTGTANTVTFSNAGVTKGVATFPVASESTSVSVRSASGAVVRTLSLG
jgi:flagellar basal-body rod modification protein FlgD